MAYEVEVKYPLADETSLRQQLAQLQAKFLDRVEQEDEYLAHPVRDFSQTDEAFRIRRIGQENRVTYKGPLLDSATKTREEIELAFEPGADVAGQMRTMLQKLGFQPVYRVRKQREQLELSYADYVFEIAIDEVEGLGKYVELECVADEQNRETVQQVILELAKTLGLGPVVERRSYLRLLLAKQQTSSI